MRVSQAKGTAVFKTNALSTNGNPMKRDQFNEEGAMFVENRNNEGGGCATSEVDDGLW
jgi:hypothetical protein